MFSQCNYKKFAVWSWLDMDTSANTRITQGLTETAEFTERENLCLNRKLLQFAVIENGAK